MLGIIIKEFHSEVLGNHFWRIDWVGKLLPFENHDSEQLLQVFLTRLEDGFTNPLSNKSLTQKKERVYLRSGWTPILQIGSVWKEGCCISYPQQGPGEAFEIDTADALFTTITGTITRNNQQFKPLPKSHYPLGDKEFGALRESPLLCIPVNTDKYKFLIIPSFEIFRSYYGCTTLLTQCVLENDPSFAIDLEKSEVLQGSIVRITLEKKTADEEAWCFARWITSDVMQRQIDGLNRSLMTANNTIANHHNKTTSGHFIDIKFPFEGKSKLTVVGKPIKLGSDPTSNDDVWAYLALGIKGCSHPMPFKKVIVLRKNDNQKGLNSEDPDLTPTNWGAKRIYGPGGLPDVLPKGALRVASEEPSSQIRNTSIALFKQRFSDLWKKQLLHQNKDLQVYKSFPRLISSSQLIETFSTGSGSSANRETGRLSLTPGEPPVQPPEDQPKKEAWTNRWTLEAFLKVISLMKEEQSDWVITTIGVTGASHHTDTGEIITCFREEVPHCHSWHLSNRKDRVTRGVVIARIDIAERVYYLLELERKQPSNSYSTALLHTAGFEQIQDRVLDGFLKATARRNRWPSLETMPLLIRTYIEHPDFKENSEEHIKELSRRITNAINECR